MAKNLTWSALLGCRGSHVTIISDGRRHGDVLNVKDKAGVFTFMHSALPNGGVIVEHNDLDAKHNLQIF